MSDLFGGLPIKAISLWQPWAALVSAGVKIDETRHWATAYRGPIAIHAAKTVDIAGAPDDLCRRVLGSLWREQVARGAVVAVARLTACVATAEVADITRANRASGNFTPGRFAWRLEGVRALVEPMPVAGRQGLFNWTPPEDLGQRLGQVVDHQAVCSRIGWL